MLGTLAWAATAPIRPASRDEVFEIPHGTWARRMAGDPVEILPDTIRLTLGINDVLLLRNLDDVPQVFGPALIMPGQSFRLPFEVASTYSFACSAHAKGAMSVIVDPEPVRAGRRCAGGRGIGCSSSPHDLRRERGGAPMSGASAGARR